MSYSKFKAIAQAKAVFGLSVLEGDRFLLPTTPVQLSATLQDYLFESLPLVATPGSEKARSDGIIYPVLLEVRRALNREVSVFSGEKFNVDESVGLNGVCDFLLTRSRQVLEISSPAVVIVEAKKIELKLGLGQCIAEMVAAQQFNQSQDEEVSVIYGVVSNRNQWQYLKLEKTQICIDLSIYPLPPVEVILGDLVWMLRG